MVNPLSGYFRTPVSSQTRPLAGGDSAMAGPGLLLALLRLLLANQSILGADNQPFSAAGAAPKAKKRGSERDRQIIGDLNQELGIENKGGSKKVWAEHAKTDRRIKILDKNGNDKSQSGEIKSGDILEVQSQKYGVVRIQVGGDGEINGGDDRVLSVGGQTAVNNMAAGLERINQPAPTAAAGNVQSLDSAPATNPGGAGLPDSTGNPLFTEQQLRNLLAALMHLVLNQPTHARI